MKKIALLILTLTGSVLVFAQGKVGVNNTNPQGVLHVDGKKDNPATGAPNTTQADNDVIVTQDGKIGAGTLTPGARLDVRGAAQGQAIKIVDGTQGVDRVLTSDANGNAYWRQTAAVKNTILGSLSAGGVNIPSTQGSYLSTGSSITLPANSRYIVTVSFIMAQAGGVTTPANSSFWLRSFFADAPGSSTSTGDVIGGKSLISGLLPGSSNYSTLTGSVIIHNTSSNPKTYYYMAGFVSAVNANYSIAQFGGQPWSEGIMYAIPINY